ncbi:MAG: class I SAM-dependent methyltransferase [Pseudomonas sp.]|uniref:class I SAM-dependent methyltransferase n=1 Tax=Pseudomonas sp. TaxID=306 RepID=UPI002736749C|nr:class I SAM-dependent methyltransferase [Pseudomonas sp.]MDP3847286.1 class I SAM-dependent methyltransferase [Pseudomonas sp.]
MRAISELFGASASNYANYRPHYPAPLFAWLAQHSPANLLALDIGCGNGQASRPLCEHFAQVLACDGSFAQLAAAEPRANLQLLVADARQLPIAPDSLDLIIVAQALHWFADAAFFAQVSRLLKPDGLFCAWCYGLLRVNPAVDVIIEQLYHHSLKAYWPSGRSSVDCGYSDIAAPFPRLQLPAFAMQQQWTLSQLLGYLNTWSAVQLCTQQRGNPLEALLPTLSRAWGDPQQSHNVSWPLHFLAGYPSQPDASPKCTEAQ